MESLSAKVAVITGAANGLGKALALELHNRKFHLALVDVDGEGLARLQEALGGKGQTVSAHRVDVGNEADVVRSRDEILLAHGRVDMLVNNAGISISQPFLEMNLDDYRRLLDVNFWGTVYCTRHFLPHLQNQQESRLVNVISDFALMGFPGKSAYASSKSAVMGFTNCLKTELAGSGLSVSLVIPPPMDTGLVRMGRHVNEQKRAREAAFLKKHGMQPDEAARRIVGAILNGNYRVVVGRLMWGIDWASRVAPTMLHRMIARWKRKIDFV
jgi:short-subunit dehydrogenase